MIAKSRGKVRELRLENSSGQQEGSIQDDGAYQVMGNRDGIAGRSFSYQDYNLQDICCIDIDGKPIIRPDGYASWKADFDKRGNEIRISYYGTDGNLALNALGFAIIEADYDSGGNMTRKRFYGIDGELLDEVVFDEEEDGESA